MAASPQPVAAAPIGEAYRERILFAIDNCCEMNVRLGGTKQPMRMDYIMQCINSFVTIKHGTSSQHLFGLCTFDALPTWVCNFTNNIDSFKQSMKRVQVSQAPATQPFDLTSILRLCASLPESEREGLRIIIIFGRIGRVPVVDREDPAYKLFAQTKNFAVDSVYVHEKSAQAQIIYDVIIGFEEMKSNNYFFESARHPRRLWSAFFSLIAHPAQRPAQEACEFDTPLFPVQPPRPAQ